MDGDPGGELGRGDVMPHLRPLASLQLSALTLTDTEFAHLTVAGPADREDVSTLWRWAKRRVLYTKPGDHPPRNQCRSSRGDRDG